MYVIKNGTLYTMDGQGVVQGDIRIDKGKIVEIAPGLDAGGAEVIDASGKIVTPGFVDAPNQVGGIFSPTEGGQDLNEMTNPLTPELDALYGIDPEDRRFKTAIAQGITTSCLAPGSANVVCGWAVAYKSAGKDRVLRRPAAMKAAKKGA